MKTELPIPLQIRCQDKFCLITRTKLYLANYSVYLIILYIRKKVSLTLNILQYLLRCLFNPLSNGEAQKDNTNGKELDQPPLPCSLARLYCWLLSLTFSLTLHP